MDGNLYKMIDQHVPRMRPKGFGITASEYSKKKGCSPHYARKILMELEAAGVLVSETMLNGKSSTVIYYKAKSK